MTLDVSAGTRSRLDELPFPTFSVDLAGRLVDASASCLSVLGLRPSDVAAGTTVVEIMTVESLDRFRTLLDALRENDHVQAAGFVFRRRDGASFPAVVAIRAVREGGGRLVAGTVSVCDLSAEPASGSVWAASRAQLAEAIECLPKAVAVFDAEDRVIAANADFRALFGAAGKPVPLGDHFETIVRGCVAAGCLSHDPTVADSIESFIARRRNGNRSTVLLDRHGRKLRWTDRVAHSGAIVSMIAEIDRDAERAHLLEQARVDAERASAAKSAFLASMSHELRTPLNAILGFAELLLRDRRHPLEERQKDHVRHVLRAGEHLLRLVSEVLDLARIESGGATLEIEPRSVAQMLADVTHSLVPLADSRAITIETPDISAPDLYVLADRTRLVQILLNLGNNAVKYNRLGGRIRFLARPHGEGTVRISVEDSGLGIAASRHKDVFGAFQRLGQESGPIEGTGIGLSLSRLLAERMGGSVSFDSVEGVGSTFHVDLPASPHRNASSAPPENLHLLPRRREPLVVLYVEDNPQNRTFMSEALTAIGGADLLLAPNAEIGVDIAIAHVPDLIILDLNLPGMRGEDALERLRAHPDTKHVPTIALSANALERDVQRALAAGFDRYLVKPVRIGQLEEVLHRASMERDHRGGSRP